MPLTSADLFTACGRFKNSAKELLGICRLSFKLGGFFVFRVETNDTLLKMSFQGSNDCGKENSKQ